MTTPDSTITSTTPEQRERRAAAIRGMREHLDMLERHPEIPIFRPTGYAYIDTSGSVRTRAELDALAVRYGGKITRGETATWLDTSLVLSTEVRGSHAVFLDDRDAGRPL